MKKLLFLLIINIGSIYSQDINFFVKEIKEERNSDQEKSFLELGISISGIKINESSQVKIKEISNAVDDKGNILKKKDSFFDDDYSSSSNITLKLEAPSRDSKKINTIQGIVKYFTPSKDTDSKLIINNPLNKFNTNLLGNKYKNITLTLVSKEALEKLQKEDKKEYQKKIEQLKSEGVFGNEIVATVDAFKGFFEGFFNLSNSKESFTFFIDDAEEKIVDILIYNEKGEKMNYGSSSSNRKKTISLKEEPKNDWSIEILIEDEKSLKEFKFSIENLILP
jgi:hypothetical protein